MSPNQEPMFKYLLPVALFLVLVGFLFVGLYRDPSELPSPLIGKPVPQFSLPRLNDANTFTDKEFLGKVSLLMFGQPGVLRVTRNTRY